METRGKQTMTLAQILSSGLLRDNPISAEDRPKLFKECCFMVCPSFVVDETNKRLMNDIFCYVEKRSGRFDPGKGLWLWGTYGTGKSTIIQIIKTYDTLSSGLSIGGYPVGGFRIDSASTVAAKYQMKGPDALSSYTYNNGNPTTIAFDELGRETFPAKYFGTELNVMQYIFQCRYEFRHEVLTHVTTNMTLKETQSTYGSYIADRINEMFNVIEIKGETRR